jgi:hypothetical protein
VDGRVPIGEGGASLPLPEIDTSELRDAVADLLLCVAELHRPLSPFAKGQALMLSPRFELEDLGRSLLVLEERSALVRAAARAAYAELRRVREARGASA